MYININKQWSSVLKPIITWLIVFGIYTLFFSFNNSNYRYSLSISLCITALSAIVTYIFTKRLFPKFLFEGKYVYFLLYSFYVMVFASYVIVITMYGYLFFMFDFNMEVFPSMSKSFSSIFLLILIITGLIASYDLLKFNHSTVLNNQGLKQKIVENQLEFKTQELNYLRAQLNPHFLFNTLNTLYGLSIKQSDLTSAAILKLSSLINYSLYKANKLSVLLQDEVDHLNEYMEMEMLRFGDNLHIKKRISVIPDTICIPPMMLITFVENAFKHGRLASGNLRISIRLKIIDESLLFIIANSKPSKPIEELQGGLGIKTLEKRLKLNYNDGYTLRTINTSDAFFSALVIKNINPNL
ncbi:sensor histidine kinase [Saccharicrinis aurantiacus]|uniref:sensor histidine kinase n=1 Tax=Saccharicrinis aurantiacus TaxID=1849719 RepID=UPI00094F693D|nr:histidine kinase [Saccharicrinis aurantiacus]